MFPLFGLCCSDSLDSLEFSEPGKWGELNSVLLGEQFPFPGSVSFSGSGSVSPHPIQARFLPGEDEPNSSLDTLKALPSPGGLRTNPPACPRPATLHVLEAGALSFLVFPVKVLERGCNAVFSLLPVVHLHPPSSASFCRCLLSSYFVLQRGFQL